MKSLGTGWREIRWQDVEISGGGAPRAILRATAAARAAALGVTEVLVTVTHTDTTALVMAVAVGEGNSEPLPWGWRGARPLCGRAERARARYWLRGAAVCQAGAGALHRHLQRQLLRV